MNTKELQEIESSVPNIAHLKNALELVKMLIIELNKKEAELQRLYLLYGKL